MPIHHLNLSLNNVREQQNQKSQKKVKCLSILQIVKKKTDFFTRTAFLSVCLSFEVFDVQINSYW